MPTVPGWGSSRHVTGNQFVEVTCLRQGAGNTPALTLPLSRRSQLEFVSARLPSSRPGHHHRDDKFTGENNLMWCPLLQLQQPPPRGRTHGRGQQPPKGDQKQNRGRSLVQICNKRRPTKGTSGPPRPGFLLRWQQESALSITLLYFVGCFASTSGFLLLFKASAPLRIDM